MRAKNVLLIIGFLIVSVAITAIIFLSNNKFYLEDKYYGSIDVEEIDKSKLNRLIATSESFALFVYQPMCVNSTNFEIVLTSFQNKHHIVLEKIAFSDLKGTELEDKIKYYPSFVIFNKGKVVDFLETDKDEDIDAFKSLNGFEEWFKKYVNIKDSDLNYNESTTTSSIENTVVNIPGVEKQDGKVNIYFFWGDGCPHCEHEQEFFKEIEDEYGNLYNLYMFETWYDKNNASIAKIFAKEMGEKAGGVPYTIIGSKTFSGFGSSSKNKFIDAIKEEAKKDFDIYIDVIKDKYKK